MSNNPNDANCHAQAKQTFLVQIRFCMQAFIRAVSGSKYDMSTDNTITDGVCISKEVVNQTPRCIPNSRHSRPHLKVVTNRVRDREPSRISLRKVMQSLKCLKCQSLFHLFCIILHQIINNGISDILRAKTVSTVITCILFKLRDQQLLIMCQKKIFYCLVILN